MKQVFHDRCRFAVQPVFWLFFVLSLVLVPVKWVLVWFFSVLIHELGHYAGLKIFHIEIYTIVVKLSGTYMHTAPMTAGQEMIVAAMGPCASGFLLLLSRWFPHMAICALVQIVFNLLPLGEFDGARILHAGIYHLLPPRYAETAMCCIQIMSTVFLLMVSAVLTVRFRLGLLPFAMVFILLLRGQIVTFPCKQSKQIVQWCKRPKRGIYNERTASKDPAHRAEACPLHRR